MRGLFSITLMGLAMSLGSSNVPRAAAGCRSRNPLHAFAAMAAFALGIVQFAAPKGRCHTGRRLDLGGLMAWWRSARSGSTRSGCVGPLEPDPSAVDLHADHAGDRGVASQAAQGRAPRITMISIFCGRAGHCRAVHLRARAGSCMRWFSAPEGRRRKRRLDAAVCGPEKAGSGGPCKALPMPLSP